MGLKFHVILIRDLAYNIKKFKIYWSSSIQSNIQNMKMGTEMISNRLSYLRIGTKLDQLQTEPNPPTELV